MDIGQCHCVYQQFAHTHSATSASERNIGTIISSAQKDWTTGKPGQVKIGIRKCIVPRFQTNTQWNIARQGQTSSGDGNTTT